MGVQSGKVDLLLGNVDVLFELFGLIECLVVRMPGG